MRVFINPDRDFAAEVRQQLKDNDGYCPCRVEHLPENHCMCEEFRNQKEGYCHCGLYLKMAEPEIITLCGSTRFKKVFLKVAETFTLEGKIILMPGAFGHDVKDENLLEEIESKKPMLDELHKRKIDMSDAIFVINVGGYIGESTRGEINYAIDNGKKVYYLEEAEI